VEGAVNHAPTFEDPRAASGAAPTPFVSLQGISQGHSIAGVLRLLPLGLLALVSFFGSASLHARLDDASSWQKAEETTRTGEEG